VVARGPTCPSVVVPFPVASPDPAVEPSLLLRLSRASVPEFLFNAGSLPVVCIARPASEFDSAVPTLVADAVEERCVVTVSAFWLEEDLLSPEHEAKRDSNEMASRPLEV